MLKVEDIKIGSKLESNKMVMLIKEINEKKRYFKGVAIHKGIERGTVFLHFKTLDNPHYNKSINII